MTGIMNEKKDRHQGAFDFFEGYLRALVLELPFLISVALLLFVKEARNVMIGIGLFIVMILVTLGLTKLMGG